MAAVVQARDSNGPKQNNGKGAEEEWVEYLTGKTIACGQGMNYTGREDGVQHQWLADLVSLTKEPGKGQCRFSLTLEAPIWHPTEGIWRKLETNDLNSEEKERAMIVGRAELTMMSWHDDALGESVFGSKHWWVSFSFHSNSVPAWQFNSNLFWCTSNTSLQSSQTVIKERYLPSKSTSVLMMPLVRQCTAFPEAVWFYSQLYQTTGLLWRTDAISSW